MKYLFLLFCLILCSCNQGTYCNESPPPPKLGLRSVFSFNWQEGFDSTFISNSSYWWFEDTGKEECIFLKPAEEPNYCENNYCNEDKNHIMKINCSWFSAVKRDDSTVIVSVKQNDTEKIRKTSITLGGYYRYRDDSVEETDYVISGGFKITQCPEPIKFSKEELLFNAEGGVDTITVNRGGTKFELHPEVLYSPDTLNYIKGLYPYYSYPYYICANNCNPMPMPIEGPWFNIDMLGENKIIVSVSKNKIERPREISMTFHNRVLEKAHIGNLPIIFNNCFEERIHVIQSAE